MTVAKEQMLEQIRLDKEEAMKKLEAFKARVAAMSAVEYAYMQDMEHDRAAERMAQQEVDDAFAGIVDDGSPDAALSRLFAGPATDGEVVQVSGTDGVLSDTAAAEAFSENGCGFDQEQFNLGNPLVQERKVGEPLMLVPPDMLLIDITIVDEDELLNTQALHTEAQKPGWMKALDEIDALLVDYLCAEAAIAQAAARAAELEIELRPCDLIPMPLCEHASNTNAAGFKQSA